MIKKILRRIFLKDFEAVKIELNNKLKQLNECINLFELGADIHVYDRSILIIIRRDKQEIRFLECPDNEYIEHIIKYLKSFQNRTIDAEISLRRCLHEVLENE